MILQIILSRLDIIDCRIPPADKRPPVLHSSLGNCEPGTQLRRCMELVRAVRHHGDQLLCRYFDLCTFLRSCRLVVHSLDTLPDHGFRERDVLGALVDRPAARVRLPVQLVVAEALYVGQQLCFGLFVIVDGKFPLVGCQRAGRALWQRCLERSAIEPGNNNFFMFWCFGVGEVYI